MDLSQFQSPHLFPTPWSPWLTWPTVAPAEEGKKNHNKSEHGKAEIKWKTISLVCGLDLPAYNGPGFPSSLGSSVGTAEMGYVCVRAPEIPLLHSGLCCCRGGDMAHSLGSLDASQSILLEAKKWHLQPGYSARILKIWSNKGSSCSFLTSS